MILSVMHGSVVLVLGIGVGFGISRSGFCLSGVFRDWGFSNQYSRLFLWISALCIASSGLILIQLIPFFHNDSTLAIAAQPFKLTLTAVVGSMMLGVGMGLAQVCPMKLLVRLGHGQITGFIGVGVMLMSVLVLYWADFGFLYPSGSSVFNQSLLDTGERVVVLLGNMVFIGYAYHRFRWKAKIVLNVLLIGIAYACMLVWSQLHSGELTAGIYGLFVLGVMAGARLESIKQAWAVHNDLGLISMPRQLLGMIFLGVGSYLLGGDLFNLSFSGAAFHSVDSLLLVTIVGLCTLMSQKILR